MLKKILIGLAVLIALVAIGSAMGGGADTGASDTATVAKDGKGKSKPEPKPEPKFTVAQEAAIRTAQSYVDTLPFSRAGLIDQMTSEYGSQYDRPLALFAVNHVDVDYNAEAVEAAQSYLDTMGYSRQGLIDQMTSPHGSQFTAAQATQAVNKIGL